MRKKIPRNSDLYYLSGLQIQNFEGGFPHTHKDVIFISEVLLTNIKFYNNNIWLNLKIKILQ